MFMPSLKIAGSAVAQIFILGAMGYFLVKKNVITSEGLDCLSRIVMDITLPLMIFCQLVKDFNFNLYPDWWVFPLLSIAITLGGIVVGAVFAGLFKGQQHKLQFLSLAAFQNSGYLPLALAGALLPQEQMGSMFIYIFLFLMGFNLVMFSLGVYMLTFHKDKKFEPASFFSAPVVAVLASLLIIFLGLAKYIPAAALNPLQLTGNCTLPLAMFLVGGSLAEIRLRHVDKKTVFIVILAKMIIMPLLGLLFMAFFKLPYLVGLLILIQLMMPSATTLSVIVRHYKKEDLIVTQGIFYTHLASIITIPVFLSIYFAMSVVK